MRLHGSGVKSAVTAPYRTFMRWKTTQAIKAVDLLYPRLTTLGFRCPSAMRLEKVPFGVTRVEIIKELMAAGPIGRVLTLSISAPATGTCQTMRPIRTRVTIEYDTRGEVERLAHLIREGAFTIRGIRPRPSEIYGEPGTPPWLALDAHLGDTPVHLLQGSQLPSRVVRILGPADLAIMRNGALRAIFQQRNINIESECVRVYDYPKHDSSTRLRIIEWRFCDWTTQARHAYLALRHTVGIHVAYGLDPCERGYSLSDVGQPSPSRGA